MNTAYLLLGGNLGDKKTNLQVAIKHLQLSVGDDVKTSSVYETEPWGFEHEESFLNQVLLVETKNTAYQLLKKVLAIELKMGRTRSTERYSGRTIDIDLLFFNDDVINETNLIVPHPRIQERKFALVPLNELIPNYIHPVYQKNISQLLAECDDQLLVKQI